MSLPWTLILHSSFPDKGTLGLLVSLIDSRQSLLAFPWLWHSVPAQVMLEWLGRQNLRG
jgi:hypothetical protein